MTEVVLPPNDIMEGVTGYRKPFRFWPAPPDVSVFGVFHAVGLGFLVINSQTTCQIYIQCGI